MGTWAYIPDKADPFFVPKLSQMNGVFSYLGFPSWAPRVNGVRNPGSIGPVRLADITDGTSTTIAFGEHAHGRLEPHRQATATPTSISGTSGARPPTATRSSRPSTRSIPGGRWTTRGVPGDASPDASAYVLAASSFHPGGANFAFVDGSVRFLKDTIDSWSYDPQTGLPTNVTLNGQGIFVPGPGSLKVYQALSTRNGGEVISGRFVLKSALESRVSGAAVKAHLRSPKKIGSVASAIPETRMG